MTKALLLFACLILAPVAGAQELVIHVDEATADDMQYYLFAYFEDSGDRLTQESLRFAVSRDAREWFALNAGRPVLCADSIASTCGLRDPHILRGEDGGFRMVATDMSAVRHGWTSNPGLVLLRSADLVHWTHTCINLPAAFPAFADARYVWAPQTIYDEQAGRYLVYFTIYRQGDTYGRFYGAYADSSFTALTCEPFLMFAPENGGLDADIVFLDGTYHFFYKGCTVDADGRETHNGIRQATAPTLMGPWQETGQYADAYWNTRIGVEGSCVFPLIGGQEWVLMYDLFGSHRYEFQTSSDLHSFSKKPQAFTKDFSPRHGTVMQISALEAARLAEAFPSKTVAVRNK